jgi:putative phosphonate metabolism protein
VSDTDPRYAIYWAPERAHPLSRAAAAWLGRDAEGGAPEPGPAPDGLTPSPPSEITAEAARYGFHATLKPPMRLHPDVSPADLRTALELVAASIPAFPMPALAVAELDGFLCLRENPESAALQALCDAVVAGFDHLRAAPSKRELEKRRAAKLSPAQEANLIRWGYPYVFATWFFHMTLTRRLRPVESAKIRPMAERWFAEALQHPLQVADLCLFEQSAPGLPFMITDRVPLAAVR